MPKTLCKPTALSRRCQGVATFAGLGARLDPTLLGTPQSWSSLPPLLPLLSASLLLLLGRMRVLEGAVNSGEGRSPLRLRLRVCVGVGSSRDSHPLMEELL